MSVEDRVLRIGVTGHRAFDDPPAHVEARVAAGLTGLLRLAEGGESGSRARLEVLSGLAEGADRLVARIALQVPGATLVAVLPFPDDDYERDFRLEPSKREFRGLLARARQVEVMGPTASREAGHELQGRWIVERSQALTAVWDGQPSRGRGGTAEMVAYAADRGVPILWVRVGRPAPPGSTAVAKRS